MNDIEAKKFGMFVHWGIYAIPAMHEQYWQRWNIPREKYVKFADQFNPHDFNPSQWLDLAQEAGMEYICFTTKHHDGFCMWNTKYTDFNIMHTPYGKDVLGLLAEECHRRNFPLMLYYSIVDWHHPAYPNIGRHHEIMTEQSKHDMSEYIGYLKAQLTELCSNYGKIHGIWWDMNVPEHKDASIHELIKELQPEAIINNRGFADGDFSTPERDWNIEGADTGTEKHYKMVEACQSVGVNSWCYKKDEDYFSSQYLMQCIDRWLAKGARYLLNIGPDATGKIPLDMENILRNIGKWMRNVRIAFDGIPISKIFDDNSLGAVRNGNILYVHCPEGLSSSTLNLKPFSEKPKNVTLMNNGEKLDWTFEPIVYYRDTGEKYLRIRKIANDILTGPPVIKIEL